MRIVREIGEEDKGGREKEGEWKKWIMKKIFFFSVED